MRLSQRLLGGSLTLVGLLVAAIVLIAGSRLSRRLATETEAELAREARLIGISWRSAAMNADSLADAAGTALERRVTLIDSTGVVIGDSQFDGTELTRLENHATRPEIAAARHHGTGTSIRPSTSAGDEEMYFAARHPFGYVRVSIGTTRFVAIVRGAQRDVVVASLVALVGALVLAMLFSRHVSRPIVELSDVARAIAAGDLSRHPSLTAPGEVGDLAMSVRRMTDELRLRLDAMAAEDARLVAIIESLDEAIVALDGRGDVVRMNEAARRLFGTRTGLPMSALELPIVGPVRDAMMAAIRGHGTEGTELTVGERIVLLTARPLPAGGAVVAILDLTERRRLETVRRDFVANVSHELKTPLTVIGGFVETLRDPMLAAEDRQRFVELMATNATRMQRIVDDLLDLSRYESGTWIPHPATIELRTVVDEVFAVARSAAELKGLTLRSEIDASAATVHADPTAMRQILGNLVENAVRYTSSGGVTVSTKPGPNGMVTIVVRDTGPGIATEHLGRIFERFYRVDPARSRVDGGTGLGLAIVRHLVEASGGSVRADSDKGTSITVVLPSS